MARVVGALCLSHSPYIYTTPDIWAKAMGTKSFREDVPRDSHETNVAKYERCVKALETLRRKVEEIKPDVLVIFGDDQQELYNFNNFPAFGIFLGAEFEGYRIVAYAEGLPPLSRGKVKPKTAEHWVKLKGHPELAKELLAGLMKRGFDLAFSMDNPNTFDMGMSNSVMRPAYSLSPNADIPVVPFLVNCYYAPEPTGKRCYELGRAIREVIEGLALDLKVAVVGSGGLWHTPGARNVYIDEEFDKVILDAVRSGDARKMADHLDYSKPPSVTAADRGAPGRGGFETGLPGGGIGFGIGEMRNWIVTAAVVDGSPGVVVDYVPVYASPCGMGFAYWDKI